MSSNESPSRPAASATALGGRLERLDGVARIDPIAGFGRAPAAVQAEVTEAPAPDAG